VRLAALLRDQLTPRQAAPADRGAARQARHSRQTVGKALRILEKEGLIYRVPGLGDYAAEPD